MKKAKIIVPAIALLALGVAGSTLGTVAWFAAAGANITSQVGATGNVSATSTVSTVDTFSVTASFTAPGAVKLTDSAGKTFMWDGHNNYEVTDTGTAMAAVAIKLTIAYTGTNDNLNDAAIQSLWETTIDGKSTLNLLCHDNTDYTSTSAPANGNSPKAIKDAAAAVAGKTDQYGLKFASASNDYDNVGDVNVEFDKAEVKGSAFSSKSVQYTLSSLVYVGVWGIDGFEQKSADAYVMKVTPAIS